MPILAISILCSLRVGTWTTSPDVAFRIDVVLKVYRGQLEIEDLATVDIMPTTPNMVR